MILLSILLQTLVSQAVDKPAMADGLRADGKIWVVIAVIMVVFSGFVTLLFFIDARIKRAEAKIDSRDAVVKQVS